MLHLDSLSKTLFRLGLILVLMISVQSCRKKIIHEPSIAIGEENWVSIPTGDLMEVHTIEVFNNRLYIGGRDASDKGKVLSYANGQFSNFLSGTMYNVTGGATYDDPIVLDLTVINSKLHIAGNFQYNDGVNATSFMTYDSNGNLEAIPLLSYNQTSISDVSEFSGDLIVCGDFGTFEPLVTSSNIERIQGGTAIGLEYLQAPVRQAIEFNNELYAVGDNIKLQKWTGSNWAPELFGSAYDEVYGMQVFNSELYVFGSFVDDVLLKKLDSLGDWKVYNNITSYTNSNNDGGIEVLDNELFIFGHHIMVDGKTASNIIKLEGDEWVNIGNFQNEHVIDLAKFEESLYLVTGGKFYSYPYP